MSETIIIIIFASLFFYLLYKQYTFQKNIFFATPTQQHLNPVDAIITPSTALANVQEVSTGYTNQIIETLKPSNPHPFNRQVSDNVGNFPEAEIEQYAPITNVSEYPNNYTFTIKSHCQNTTTGLYTECGI